MRNRINKPGRIILSICLIFNLNAGTILSEVPNKAVLDSFLKQTVKKYRIPGLAVAVLNDKEILYAKGFEGSSPDAGITPGTPFLLGSTTKSFTAIAIIRLVEKGEVDIDSPVIKYIPEFSLAIPGCAEKITIRHLLNHTSGLSDKGMPYSSMGEASLDDELILLKQCVPESAPGKKFIYFNDNYRLLGMVIQNVSGMKYGEFLASEIFGPLGMKSSYAGPAGVEDLAPGYGEIFGFPFRREQKYRPGALPSGYVVSSASDIARYMMALLNAGKGDTSIFNPELIKLTWQPPENIKGGYGMGWMVFDTIGKTPFLGHGGSLENYHSFFYLNPEHNLGFVFLMNQGGIIPMSGAFGTIRNGMIKIMDGENPDGGPGSKPVILIAAVFFLILAFELFLVYRVRGWKLRSESKKKWKRWTGIIADLVISVALLILVIKGWIMLYNLLPELFIILLIMIAAGLLRSFLKLRVILG
jgi:CubicO group peptidase (beta-lactamase class C family)